MDVVEPFRRLGARGESPRRSLSCNPWDGRARLPTERGAEFLKSRAKALSRSLLERVVLAAACFALAAPPAECAPATGYVLGGAALQEAPSEFENHWESGVGFGAGAGVPLLSHVELAFSFSLDRFETKGSFGPSILGEEVDDGGNATILALLTEVRLHPFSGGFPIAPYFGGGVGFLRKSFEDVHTSAGADVELDPDNALAVTGGGGFRINLRRGLRLVLDGRYTVGFSEGEETRYLPIRIGLSIG